MSKELEDYKIENQRFMQDMNNKITTGKAEHIELSNEVSMYSILYLRRALFSEVPLRFGKNLTGGKILYEPKCRFIAQSPL